MSNIEYRGNKIHIGSHTVTLPDEIENVVEINNTIILLLEPFGKAAPQNVVAFDDSGTKVWDIDTTPAEEGKSSPYTGLKKTDSRIIAFGYNSRRYEVDPQTGSIEDIEFFK
jgi:hypothetical protein